MHTVRFYNYPARRTLRKGRRDRKDLAFAMFWDEAAAIAGKP